MQHGSQLDSGEDGKVSVTILDTEMSIDGGKVISCLHFRVVSPKEGWTSFLSDKILVCLWSFTFSFHGIHIDHMALDTIEDLDTSSPPQCPTIGETSICCYRFTQAVYIEERKAQFPVSLQWDLVVPLG